MDLPDASCSADGAASVLLLEVRVRRGRRLLLGSSGVSTKFASDVKPEAMLLMLLMLSLVGATSEPEGSFFERFEGREVELPNPSSGCSEDILERFSDLVTGILNELPVSILRSE
jgi:hypothetical protein